MLNLTQSFKALNGFPLASYKIISSEKDLSFSYPCFMKADISEHKTEKNAVLKCNSEKEANKNFQILRKKFPKENILIQEQAEGIEMILGLKEDKVFGKLLMAGFGGINAEVMKNVSFRALPIDRKEIEKMIKELKLFPSLVKRKKYALDKFISLAEKVSKLNVKELDLNPVMLNEKEALIVDARIEV